MDEAKTWVIIDAQRSTAINGYGNKALRFSTREIAREVAEQLFSQKEKFLLVQIMDHFIPNTAGK